MQPQILKVEDPLQSVKEHGILPFLDHLLQDMAGNYYFLDSHRIDLDKSPGDEWEISEDCVGVSEEDDLPVIVYHAFKVMPIPVKLAWFCIDALRLKSQVMGIGDGEYDGPHGGDLHCYVPDKEGTLRKVESFVIQEAL